VNILIITSHYPSKDHPTKAIYNKYTFNALSEYCNIYLISPLPWWRHFKKIKVYKNGFKENVFGITAEFRLFYSVPGLRVLHSKGMYYSLKSYVSKLNKKHNFKVLLSTWVYPDATAAAKIAKKLNIPIIITALGSDINELTKFPLLRKQIFTALNTANKVITVSEDLKKKIMEIGINFNKIQVLHNNVDGKIFTIRDKKEAKRKLNLENDSYYILYVGNLNSEKGVHVLLKAFLILSKRLLNEKIKLIIVGDGNERLKMELFTERNNLSNSVDFKGRLLAEQVAAYMNGCDLLCLPSYREGCPNVILEALASGLPVVASNVGGIPEIINKTNGILTEAGDEYKLALGLKKALQVRWSPEELRKTVKSLSWASVGENYYKWIMESVKSNSY